MKDCITTDELHINHKHQLFSFDLNYFKSNEKFKEIKTILNDKIKLNESLNFSDDEK